MALWWRAYNEALDDPKLQKLPLELFKAWFNLVCLASRNDGTLPAVDDIAFALRTNPQKADKILAALIDANLFDKTPEGVKPHNWSSRQYESDVSTSRVKRFRQRSRNAKRNGPETEQNRAEAEQSRAEPPLSGNDVSRETFLQTCWTLTECDKSPRPFSEMVFGQWWSEGARAADLAVIPPILERQRIGEPRAIMPPGYYTNAVREAMRKRTAGTAQLDELRSKIEAWSKTDAA